MYCFRNAFRNLIKIKMLTRLFNILLHVAILHCPSRRQWSFRPNLQLSSGFAKFGKILNSLKTNYC